MLGKIVKANCSECDCGEERIIVNKTRFLCDAKNKIRLGTKMSKPLRQSALLSRKGLKPGKKRLKLSKKKVEQNDKYHQVCEVILEERGALCQGCRTADRLSFSHLTPRSRKPKLIEKKENIHIHCMDGDGIEGCHTKCEAGKFDEMLDGDQIIAFLEKYDNEYLQLKLRRI